MVTAPFKNRALGTLDREVPLEKVVLHRESS